MGDRALREPGEITSKHLRDRTLSDLVRLADDEGPAAVETWLDAALVVTAEVLADHDKELSSVPVAVYELSSSGLRYDPYHSRGEAVIIGGPRGSLRGGYQVLASRGAFEQRSLLTVLGKGLLHSYNQELVDEHFENGGDSSPATMDQRIDLYEEVWMLALAVDQGLTQPFGLHLAADVTDRALREAFIDAWVAWNREFTDMQVAVFEAVARTISDRVEAADGSARDRIVHGLAIQEPLVRDGDTSVITHRDPLDGPREPR